MKARPRRAEREIALILSALFEKHGYTKVERIPVLGRAGPDIEINEFGLVVDVKSRLEVPRLFAGESFDFGGLIGFPASESWGELVPHRPSILVEKWFAHLDEWRISNYPSGITALVLHRPGVPYGRAVMILAKPQTKEFINRWTLHSP